MIGDDPQQFTTPSRRGVLSFKGLMIGALVGLAGSLFLPRNYVAEVTLLFPTINSNALKQVTKTMQMDGSGVDWNKTTSVSDAQLVDAAAQIMRSRAAVESSVRDAKVILPRTVLALQGEPVDYFRTHNLEVDASEAFVTVKVAYSRAEIARALCQGFLNYYSTFVREHRLTNTARTRQQLEEKLVRVDKRLSVLERKLLITPDSRLRSGDSAGGLDPKVMRELWKQRILEGGSSGRILDEMRKIRKGAGNATVDPGDTQIGEDWRSRWGSTTLENAEEREGSLPRNTRRADLPSRLELERVYEETLLLYHAGLLQYDFLTMWEGLENFDFEIVDPLAVHQAGTLGRSLALVAVGGLLGAGLGGFLRRSS